MLGDGIVLLAWVAVRRMVALLLRVLLSVKRLQLEVRLLARGRLR